MKQRSDLDRVLEVWMADGPTAISDRVVDVVAARIGVQRQRRAWPFQGRTTVTQLKLAAALAAVVSVAVVGYNLLPRQGGFGGQATPSPTVAPTTAATAVGIQDVSASGQRLDPGRWRFHPVADSPSLFVVADIPAGWLALESQLGLENVIATNSAPSGLAIVFGQSEHGLYSDPCHWDLNGTGTLGEGDVEVGPDVADLVAALRANTSYTSSTPSAVTFGPYEGQQLELQFPADLDPATCDKPTGKEEGNYFVMPDEIHSQGPANIWRMFILDVAGTRITTIIEYFPGTAPEKLAEAEAIVDSLEFTP